MHDPAITYGIVFSNFMSKGVFTFEGGTDSLLKEMRAELARNGVELYGNVQVQAIDVRNGEVRGVVANGRTISAKSVVSNANLKSTVEDLVDARALDSGYLEACRKVRLNNSSCQVFLGIERGAEIPFVTDLLGSASTRETFDSPAPLRPATASAGRSPSITRRRARRRAKTETLLRSSARPTRTGTTGPTSTTASTYERREERA